MVARGGEGVGELAENVLAVVVNLAGLAMKNLGRANDFASEGRADGLVSEAHTKNRQFPASCGVQGPGEITMRSGLRRAISSTEILSLRWFSTMQRSSPRYCARL